MIKVRDLINVPPVRTVIRLADLNDSNLRRHIVESFVLTNEVSFTISNIFKKIATSHGEGFFIIGNYGSGKSHLLNVLSMVINDKDAQHAFIETCRENPSSSTELPDLVKQAAADKPLVVEISLVEHSNREYLEQIIIKQIVTKLQAVEFSGTGSGEELPKGETAKLPDNLLELPRQEAFELLRQALEQSGFGGLVILIDELSEFLRSKENPRAYNEDVRFLQYLAEFAEAIPAWIVATMQENIENTGALSGELLHKIKDRYPIRFHLSGEHVKEIVSGRLVRKNDQAQTELPRILEELEGAFTKLPFSRQDFFELYPVHPATVELLDELRPLFSQHRGVIDFIHYRLSGDPGRGITPFLEQPAGELLTPDYIFDHFRERLRETIETSPYSEQVYHYYEREAERIFPDFADAQIALRLLKLLILGALAQAPKRFSAEELTRLLLYRYSGLESAVNYDYINEIMEQLHAHGAYISAEEQESGDTIYTIDLKADVALLMQKKLASITSSLASGDMRIIEALLPWVDDTYLPLKQLQQTPFRDIEITWQNTKRTGKAIFNSPAEFSSDSLEELREDLNNKETDFVFFLVPPGFAGQNNTGSTWQAVYEDFDPELRRCLALWAPRDIAHGEEKQLQQAYAYQLLQEEYGSDNSQVGRQIRKQLETLIAEEKGKVKEIFRNIYFQGRLRAGEHMPSPSSYGYLPLNDLISHAASEILKARFPRHSEIRPLSEQITGSQMQRTLDILFSPQLEEQGLERGTKMMIDNYLVPLGLVKKKGQDYQLEINPKTSPLTAEFFARIPETGQISLERLYRYLRKGPFGLNTTCFQVLGTAAILSGAVSAYQGGKRLAPSQVNYYRFWNIEALGPGTLIRPELQKVLADLPFLPAKLRSGPLTFAAQQQAWEAVVTFKTEWTRKTAEINKRIEQLRKHPFFSAVNWDNLSKTVNRFNSFLDEIKTSYASREGLERFLATCQSAPLIVDDWNRLSALEDFFTGDLPEILRIGHYLKDEALVIPEGEHYEHLHQRYHLLVELLEEESILWEGKYRDRLKREFKQFQNDYITHYLAEHNNTVGPGRIKPYRLILETQAYRLLEQLGRINAVVVEDDLVSVNRRLSQPLERECREADELLLAERPACSCGFTLGKFIELPDKTDLEKQILRGIKAYLEALQEIEQKQKILAHTEHLEMVGRRREAAPLQKLLKIDPATINEIDLVDHLNPLITQNTIAQINRALTGNAMIAQRSMEELQDLLSERVFNTNQLKDLFHQWLAGNEDNPPDYIRVTRKEGATMLSRESEADRLVEKGQGAQAFLEEKFPRLTSLAGQIKEEKLFALAILWSWLKYYCPSDRNAEAPQSDPFKIFENLIADQSEKVVKGWHDYHDQLATLGESLLTERENLQTGFLERAAEEANKLITAEQLIDSYYSLSSATPHRFETLLELMVDEPFFPAVSREIAAKLAVRISAEESAPQLNIMTGMLQEVLKTDPEKGIGLTASHRAEKYLSLETLNTLAECNRILRETERIVPGPPENDKNWERLYRMLAPFELSLGRLEDIQARSLISEVTIKRWQRHYASLLEPLSEAFARYYEKTPSSRRQTLQELFRQLPGWAAREGDRRGVYLTILDGARLDIWEVILAKALADHDFQVLREGLLWAMQPTVTETQLVSLKEEGLLGHVLNMNDQLVAELISDPQAFLQAVDNAPFRSEHTTPLKAIKYNFIDEKIHASRDTLPVLVDELLPLSRKKICPLLECLPTGSILLLAADHGFKTNLYHDKSNKADPLYLHGGPTFFEALAPWILLKKK